MHIRPAPLLLVKLVTAFFAVTAAAHEGTTTDGNAPDISYDDLVQVPASKVGAAFIDPRADFSIYKRVRILEPYVAFRPKWQSDQNRQMNRNRQITASDMEMIKGRVVALFDEVFRETLEADDGYEVVNENDADVLLLRPAIINLDIAAPDKIVGGRDRVYTATAGSATLYIELFDSSTGTIIGRAYDRKNARSNSVVFTWSNNVTNAAEARRAFGYWAGLLRNFLDAHYVAARQPEDDN